MLPRRNRLPATLQLTYSSSHTSPQYRLKTAENSLGYSRAAVIISRRVAPRATVRNRLRRRIYRCLRTLWPRLRPGTDLLLIVSPSFEAESQFPCQQLLRDLRRQHLL